MIRISSAPKSLLAAVSVLALASGLSACGSDAKESTDGGAVRMAFVNGFSGGGPVDDFVAGLACYADINGLDDPLVTVADGDVNKQLSDIESLIARSGKVDGLFVMPVDPAALKPAYDRAISAGLAVIDPVSPGPDGKFATNATGHVAPDDAGVPQMLVDYLVDNHPDAKRIAILSPPPGQPMSDARGSAFTTAATTAGLDVVREINLEKITTEEAQQQVEDLLTSDRDIDAIFAQNGAMARGAALAAKSQGADLVIISLDNDAETLAAVKAGDIDASFGADLFTVGFVGSEQAAKIKAGETVAFASVPYETFTADNAEVASAADRCAAKK